MKWKGREESWAKLHPEEISAVIKERIRQYEETPEIRCMGRVVQTADGIARIYGLRGMLANSGVLRGVYGMALNLEGGYGGGGAAGRSEAGQRGG